MASTEDYFREVLSGEVMVDLEKLREVASHGIPDRVRSEVWKILLGVSKLDKSQEMKLKKNQQQEFEEALRKENVLDMKRISASIGRLKNQHKVFKNLTEDPTKMENVIVAYLNNNTTRDFDPGMLWLLVPLISISKELYECFQSFEVIMTTLDQYLLDQTIADRVGYFTTCFRSVAPELYNHMAEEDVEPAEWATSWFRLLLSRELPLSCILRLWDTYFSCDDGLELHLYVCLAVLVDCSDEILELEQQEIKGFLQHLPTMDMDKIVAQAYNIKAEMSSGKVLV